jgi:hypothetical protein
MKVLEHPDVVSEMLEDIEAAQQVEGTLKRWSVYVALY